MTVARAYDGVAFIERGDTISVLWQGAARLHRATWLLDQTEAMVDRNPDGVILLQQPRAAAET